MIELLKNKRFAVVDFEAKYKPSTLPLDMYDILCLVIYTPNEKHIFVKDEIGSELETFKMFFNKLEELNLDFVIVDTLSIFIDFIKQRLIENNLTLNDILPNCKNPVLKYYTVDDGDMLIPGNYKFDVKLSDRYEVVSLLNIVYENTRGIIPLTLDNVVKEVLGKNVSSYYKMHDNKSEEEKYKMSTDDLKDDEIVNYCVSDANAGYDVIYALIYGARHV